MNELPCTALWHATGFGPVTTKTRETSTNVDHTFSRPHDQAERRNGYPEKKKFDPRFTREFEFELTERERKKIRNFKNSNIQFPIFQCTRV